LKRSLPERGSAREGRDSWGSHRAKKKRRRPRWRENLSMKGGGRSVTREKKRVILLYQRRKKLIGKGLFKGKFTSRKERKRQIEGRLLKGNTSIGRQKGRKAFF